MRRIRVTVQRSRHAPLYDFTENTSFQMGTMRPESH
jgi:hypothetical protein